MYKEMAAAAKRKESVSGIPSGETSEYADKDVQTFDAEQMYVTLECIVIYETGRISVRCLEGTIVEL